MTPIAITLLAAALVGWLVWVQRRTGVFLEYLYFCRFPLAFGLLLAALPAIALWGRIFFGFLLRDKTLPFRG